MENKRPEYGPDFNIMDFQNPDVNRCYAAIFRRPVGPTQRQRRVAALLVDVSLQSARRSSLMGPRTADSRVGMKGGCVAFETTGTERLQVTVVSERSPMTRLIPSPYNCGGCTMLSTPSKSGFVRVERDSDEKAGWEVVLSQV